MTEVEAKAGHWSDLGLRTPKQTWVWYFQTEALIERWHLVDGRFLKTAVLSVYPDQVKEANIDFSFAYSEFSDV